jgi:adenylate kinase
MTAKIVIVAGLSGAGKTTLLDKLASSRRNFKTVPLGLLMNEEAKRLGIKTDRDTIKRLENKTISKLRTAAFRKVSKMNGNVIVDTHLSIEGPNRFVPGLPLGVLKGLNVVGIVYVNANSDEIVKRRQKDKKIRSRENQEISALDIQRTVDVSILAHYATVLDVPCYVIHNREGHSNIAAKELDIALKDAFGG